MATIKPHVKEWLALARHLGFDTARLETHLAKVEAAWAKDKPGKTAYKDMTAAHAALLKEATKRYDKLLEQSEFRVARLRHSAAWEMFRRGIADGTLDHLHPAPDPLDRFRQSFASDVETLATMTAPPWGDDALHRLAVLTAMTEGNDDVSRSELQHAPDGHG